AVLELGMVIWLQSRAAVIGLVIGLLLVLAVGIVRGEGWVRVAAAGLLLATAVSAVAFVATGTEWRDVPVATRFEGASDNPRLTIWSAALEAATERPILGIGPENAHVAITPAGGSDLYDQQLSEGIWDR